MDRHRNIRKWELPTGSATRKGSAECRCPGSLCPENEKIYDLKFYFRKLSILYFASFYPSSYIFKPLTLARNTKIAILWSVDDRLWEVERFIFILIEIYILRRKTYSNQKCFGQNRVETRVDQFLEDGVLLHDEHVVATRQNSRFEEGFWKFLFIWIKKGERKIKIKSIW